MNRDAAINLSFLAGLALLSVGLWMFAPWLSLTVMGSILITLSIAGRLT